MPVITLEVISDSASLETNSNSATCNNTENSNPGDINTGVHFLSEQIDEATKTDEHDDSNGDGSKKHELLEYTIRHDGSVLCKLCGEILQSRTHWYRHKYKFHVMPLNPAPLFQCEYCLVYFKSRKGYIGHLASRHGDILPDSSPVHSNTVEGFKNEKASQTNQQSKNILDPELAIPKSTVPNFNTVIVNKSPMKSSGEIIRKPCKTTKVAEPIPLNTSEDDERRIREEKLVADIINRVRKECEAQGPGPTRKGYSRRTTVMHT